MSAWSIAELLYATEMRPSSDGYIPSSDFDEVVAVLQDPEHGFETTPVDFEVAATMRQVPRAWTTGPWDRAIIATAIVLDATLVTADGPHRENPEIDTLW